MSVALAVKVAVVTLQVNVVADGLMLAALGAEVSEVITWVSVMLQPLSGSVIVTV